MIAMGFTFFRFIIFVLLIIVDPTRWVGGGLGRLSRFINAWRTVPMITVSLTLSFLSFIFLPILIFIPSGRVVLRRLRRWR